jgi:hypothetical protein
MKKLTYLLLVSLIIFTSCASSHKLCPTYAGKGFKGGKATHNYRDSHPLPSRR